MAVDVQVSGEDVPASLLQRAVPSRDDLRTELAQANARAHALLWPELLAVGLLAAMLSLDFLRDNAGAVALVLAFVVGDSVRGYAEVLLMKKRRVRDMPDGVRYGRYDRETLQAVVDGVQRRLGLAGDRLSVYVTGDKELNAMAVQAGAAGIFPALNAVYINRSMLHLLTPQELTYLLGHEFGHLLRYRVSWDRYRWVHLVAVAVVSLLAVQFTGLDGWLPLGAVLAVQFAASFVLSLLYGVHNHTVEFLCDDHGARLAGVAPAVSALFKMAAESEVHLALQLRALSLAGEGQVLTPREALEIYQAALPFGRVDAERVAREVERRAAHRRANDGASLAGFLRYVRDLESEETHDEREQELRRLRAMVGMPRLAWDGLLARTDGEGLSETTVESLMALADAHPGMPMFRLPEELDDRGSSHPSHQRRMRYLWRHRAAFERPAPELH